MSSPFESLLEGLADTGLAPLGIRAPFTIPSGIVTTIPSVIARIAQEVPSIGFLTTKTLSISPRPGYREPIIHEYYPGCFVNAVGLANPGAQEFRDAMEPLLPLANSKPLVVSIMGDDPNGFLECALVLDSIADAFELNLSCPHVKGAGQSVGSDPAMVRGIVQLLKRRVSKPIIPKLSPNLSDIAGMARLCVDAGADAISLINTVGPGMATDQDGYPVLSNVVGGLSGAGILPVGLKAVKEAASVVKVPLIASGGISSAEHVQAYRQAGASLFGVGSALAGMSTPELVDFFAHMERDLGLNGEGVSATAVPSRALLTSYAKSRVVANETIGDNMFRLSLASGPPCEPGRFFFLRLPGEGEKPFSPAHDETPVYLVRKVGPFTAALEGLKPGDRIYLRGPYGKGFPEPRSGRRLVLLGGGTGIAPLMMAARRWPDRIARVFFGFSKEVSPAFRKEVMTLIPDAHVIVDPPGTVGEVTRALIEDMAADPDLYEECQVFLCGPRRMMEFSTQILRTTVPPDAIFVGREDLMRCGIGACGSCGTKGGLRSCVDGPVMPPEE